MIKKTLLEWCQAKQLTLTQTQKLSEITDANTLYTLAELQLLVRLPTTPNNLDKFNSVKLASNNWWATNAPWLILLTLLFLIYLLK